MLYRERDGLPRAPRHTQALADKVWSDFHKGRIGLILQVLPGLIGLIVQVLPGLIETSSGRTGSTGCRCRKFGSSSTTLEARGMSTRGVQQVHAVLRNALQSAMRNVAKLVRVKTPRYEVGRGPSVDQARTLLRATRDDRLHALYVLAVDLGLRRGELLGLRWTDVDLDQGFLLVRHTLQRVDGELIFRRPKTRSSNRTVPFLSHASTRSSGIGCSRGRSA